MTSSQTLVSEERGARMMTLTLTAIIHKEVDLYVAECPEIGTVSQGDTVEDAIANLKEATELYLEEFPLPQMSRSLLTTFEAAVANTVGEATYA
jgi:predicted RNase H-like HicB family nuclease